MSLLCHFIYSMCMAFIIAVYVFTTNNFSSSMCLMQIFVSELTLFIYVLFNHNMIEKDINKYCMLTDNCAATLYGTILLSNRFGILSLLTCTLDLHHIEYQ